MKGIRTAQAWHRRLAHDRGRSEQRRAHLDAPILRSTVHAAFRRMNMRPAFHAHSLNVKVARRSDLNRGLHVPAVLLVLAAALMAAAAPAAELEVANPSFELDHYDTFPGYADQHGGIIGWEHTGNAGVNPWWHAPKKQQGPNHSFSDNGRIPHGKQVALLQNACVLKQRISGFQKGHEYRVTYHENARHQNQPDKNPRIKVLLGGEVVVSEHTVKPVEPINQHTLPYDFVESAVFVAPRDGASDLEFVTTAHTGVTVLVDDVQIVALESE